MQKDLFKLQTTKINNVYLSIHLYNSKNEFYAEITDWKNIDYIKDNTDVNLKKLMNSLYFTDVKVKRAKMQKRNNTFINNWDDVYFGDFEFIIHWLLKFCIDNKIDYIELTDADDEMLITSLLRHEIKLQN